MAGPRNDLRGRVAMGWGSRGVSVSVAPSSGAGSGSKARVRHVARGLIATARSARRVAAPSPARRIVLCSGPVSYGA
eukprot:6152423-Prymnesium_polylepis.1